MFKQKYIKYLTLVFLAVCCVALFASCDGSEQEVVDNSLVTLKIVLPTEELEEIHSAGTRGGTPVAGTEEESRINTVKFFIFNSSRQLEIYKDITITNGTSSDPMWDPFNSIFRVPLTTGSKYILSVANWQDGTTGMPVLDATAAANYNTFTKTLREHNNITFANPPVMVGYLAPVTVTTTTRNLDLKYTRQVARVEFRFNISQELSVFEEDVTARIKILGVRFQNLQSASYLFPRSLQSLYTAPPVNLWSQGNQDYSGVESEALTTTLTEYATKYYIPEYAPANLSTAMSMVIKASYHGTIVYYSVLINPRLATVSPLPTQYAIERNHSYRYNLTILGPGSTVDTRTIGNDWGGENTENMTYTLEVR